MTAASATITGREALTILREIDLDIKYRLTAGGDVGDCVVNGICYEKDDSFFLTVDTDLLINAQIDATLSINNIILSGLIAPTESDNKVLMARSVRYQIRSVPRIQSPKLTIKFNGLSPLVINDISMTGIGITINIDDYTKFTEAKDCTLSLDKEHIKLDCKLINSHYLGNSQARLGWIITNPSSKLQHLLTKYSTNL
jgi:hypothetical protein